MLDLLIKGGTLVDGTGAPRTPGDVGIRDGRIVALGPVREDAARTIDAAGLVVAPGFIDAHTHFDAQVFWDGAVTPSPQHGVTTIVGGNCGFSVAPLSDESGPYLKRMLARVEGIPVEALDAGVPWSWRSFGDYLSALEGRLAVNAAFMVGHSAIRRAVSGDHHTLRRNLPGVILKLDTFGPEFGDHGFVVDQIAKNRKRACLGHLDCHGYGVPHAKAHAQVFCADDFHGSAGKIAFTLHCKV